MRIDEVEQLDEFPFQGVKQFGWKSLIPFTGDRSARMATNAAEKQANAKIKYFADKNTATWMTKLTNLKASKPTITPVEIAKSFKAYAALANGGKPVTGIAIPDPSNGKLVLEFFKMLGSKLLSSAPTKPKKPKVPKIPTITAINPDKGRNIMATKVTITGTNFTGVTQVTFDTTPGTNLIVAPTGDSITVEAPVTRARGPVTVTVTSPAGTATTQFTYTN